MDLVFSRTVSSRLHALLAALIPINRRQPAINAQPGGDSRLPPFPLLCAVRIISLVLSGVLPKALLALRFSRFRPRLAAPRTLSVDFAIVVNDVQSLRGDRAELGMILPALRARQMIIFQRASAPRASALRPALDCHLPLLFALLRLTVCALLHPRNHGVLSEARRALPA